MDFTVLMMKVCYNQIADIADIATSAIFFFKFLVCVDVCKNTLKTPLLK